MIQNYCIIDTLANSCINIIVWDGVSQYNPGPNLTLQVSDGSIQIGDSVELVDSVWQKI